MADQELKIGLKSWWRSRTHDQRRAVVVLSVCGISALGLSIFQFSSQLHDPFRIPKSTLEKLPSLIAAQQAADQEDAALKNKDTDHDGLSDYDELNVYHTSPYLADSDSDGAPDAVEVAQNSDPNCPQGKTCFQIFNDVGLTTTPSSTFGEFLDISRVPTAPLDAEVGAGSATGTASPQAFLSKPPDPASLTPAEIRAYLITNHLVSADEINALSDAQVSQVYEAAYQEALRIQAAGLGGNASQFEPATEE